MSICNSTSNSEISKNFKIIPVIGYSLEYKITDYLNIQIIYFEYEVDNILGNYNEIYRGLWWLQAHKEYSINLAIFLNLSSINIK